MGDGSTAAAVLGSQLALLGTVGLHQSAEAELHGDDDCKSVFLQAWDPQHRRRLWTKQVGGEHTQRETETGSLPGETEREAVVLAGGVVRAASARPQSDCAAGRQVALAVSADTAHSLLYAADLSPAQSGYSGAAEETERERERERVQPKIVALNSDTGEIAWRHDPSTAAEESGERVNTVRLLGLGSSPLAGVPLRPQYQSVAAADGKNVATAAVAYYTAVFQRRATTQAQSDSAGDQTAVEFVVGINASGGVAWRTQGRAWQSDRRGGALTGTSGSGAVFTVATGAVASFGSQALWLVGGARHPPAVWRASNLDAPVTAAVTGRSVTAAETQRGDEAMVSEAEPEERLYLGLGVACDSCGLFGQPTGASLLALSTVPLPPSPPPKTSVAKEALEVCVCARARACVCVVCVCCVSA